MKGSQLLSAGPPPLTVTMADAAIDLIDFMAAAVRGVDLIDVTPAVREAWRLRMARYWPTFNAETREFCVLAPARLQQYLKGWQSYSEPQRTAYRQAWASVLPGLLPAVEETLQSAASSGFSASPPPASAYGHHSYPQRSSTVNSLMSEIFAGQEAEEQEALRLGGPEQAAMIKAQIEVRNAEMLSKIFELRHQARMAPWKH